MKTHPKIVVGLAIGPLLIAAFALARWLAGHAEPPVYGPGEAPVRSRASQNAS